MTMLYNLLNFPAGVVPVSTVTAEDEEELRHYTGNYNDRFDQLFKEVGNTPVTKKQNHYTSWSFMLAFSKIDLVLESRGLKLDSFELCKAFINLKWQQQAINLFSSLPAVAQWLTIILNQMTN